MSQCQHIDAPYMVTRGIPRGSDVTVCPCCGLQGDAPAGDDLAGLTCPYCHVQAVWRTDVAAGAGVGEAPAPAVAQS